MGIKRIRGDACSLDLVDIVVELSPLAVIKA